MKIVCYGPESTGKSTLSRKLTQHYHTAYIPEFARDYLQEKYDRSGEACSYEDLMPIVYGQRALESRAREEGHELLICDTDLLETLVYSKAYFNKVPAAMQEMAASDHVNLYLLMDIDIPWEKDDLRDRPEQREALFELFKNELDLRDKNYVVISGSNTVRFNTAVATIDAIIKK